MTLTVAPPSSRPSRSRARHHASLRQRPGRGGDRGVQADHGVLGRYTDGAGRPREVVVRPGVAGSVLVVDRDASTLGDRRLVAHLAADEPPGNAELVCRQYLQDPDGRWCRRVTSDDLQTAPLAEGQRRRECEPEELVSQCGYRYRLELLASDLSIPELRWCRHPQHAAAAEPEPVSLREVVACLESYRPARDLTLAALANHRDDRNVSVAVLRAELRRLDASRIVLNRGLRQAVRDAVQGQGLSMSEIAIRCGRIKYDSRGNASGETSWLARRVGISAEGGAGAPTPWIHSEVLALIARSGLGISPREVELG
jgi:hypothetical protein